MSLDLTKPRRIELILRQIDALPTLPAIATRLLSLTASEESHTREVVELVSADPALTAKVLALVRSADRGVVPAGAGDVMTVERAVMLLGFNAIRNVVLSLKVLEVFEDRADGGEQEDADGPTRSLDRQGHWLHSLGVAIAAERIAAAHKGDRELPADEAFVCGLMHGIGKLALDMVLPRSYARVIELADRRQGDIAEFERQIIGIDHHTAGKRLAEQWGLPHRLQDSIWLHGADFDTLPRLEHRRLVGLIGLAETIARQRHMGYSGNHTLGHDVDEMARRLGLDADKTHAAVADLHERVEQRGRAMGIHAEPSHELVARSIERANRALGRLNHILNRRSESAAAQARVVEAISQFHAGATPGRSVQDVLDAVGASAHDAFGPGFYALIYPTTSNQHKLELAGDEPRDDADQEEERVWLVTQYNAEGRPARTQYVPAPSHATDLSSLDPHHPAALDMLAVVPWISDYLVGAQDLRKVRLLPLACGWGTSAVLLHDRTMMPRWSLVATLSSTWGAAIAAAAQHDGARRLSEQLAESNAALAQAQDTLLRQAAMARLGEMAAGAAHEMNNPLAVISGRSQLLTMTLDMGSKEQKAAQTIYREAHRLSDLITALHLYAEPPRADRKPVDLPALLSGEITKVRNASKRQGSRCEVTLRIEDTPPTLMIDAAQLGRAVSELLLNAMQANPRSRVVVSVAMDAVEEAVVIRVEDDGDGMDEHTLEHAMDPFFSNKPAGRRVGMGLPRAQQLVAAHGGELRLESQRGEGTAATIVLPLTAVTAAGMTGGVAA